MAEDAEPSAPAASEAISSTLDWIIWLCLVINFGYAFNEFHTSFRRRWAKTKGLLSRPVWFA